MLKFIGRELLINIEKMKYSCKIKQNSRVVYLMNYINFYQLGQNQKAPFTDSLLDFSCKYYFSEQSLHVFISRQILQQLLVIMWVLWSIIVVHMVLAKLIASIITTVAIVIVCLMALWSYVRIGIIVLERLRLVHSVRLAWDILLVRYLRILLIVLGLRWVVCVFWRVVYWTEIVTFGIFNLHWNMFVFCSLFRSFLINFLLLKYLCNLVSFIFLLSKMLNLNLQTLDKSHFLLYASLNQIQVIRSVCVPLIYFTELS